MSTWHRVFGASVLEPAPATLLERLQTIHPGMTGHFSGDSQGWIKAELTYPSCAVPLLLERFLASEEGIREELNAWAAAVEAPGDGPLQHGLMKHLVGAGQLFTLRGEPGGAEATTCDRICRILAEFTAGIYQADGRGFFDARGKLLLSAAD